MRRIITFTNVTLDGVMQGPGRPDEDRRGDFTHGGWAVPYGAMMEGGDSTGETGALLFGRRTYEDFHEVWPKRKDNPYTAVLNNTPKYVASSTLKDPLPWMNSTLLKGDAADAVAKLKGEPGKDLLILGSGGLIGSLARRNLIDRYVLLIHPLVLGTGRRLFPDDGTFAALRLVQSKTTSKGVVVAAYEPGT